MVFNKILNDSGFLTEQNHKLVSLIKHIVKLSLKTVKMLFHFLKRT